ncbi:DUF268 domain-containing protein [Pelagicoccus sp. SDUM812003]|uniref:DUF268 domain-containing protein n=1 Tax=Pelagicoccus sp. SDUM812003 TaxID=3041267 RepID=UPI00280E8878|nr:DUF268 domain-containing protein [Pelagicoccus sp. SDUM812003]MDQ8205604.1 DUF268 domain-containing protein [Pelagicoccus sp. SDUM812003]
MSKFINSPRKILKKLYRILSEFGIEPIKFIRSTRSLPWYLRDYFKIRSQSKSQPVKIRFTFPYPKLRDKDTESGTTRSHYFHQDLLVAQYIFSEAPKRHIDIGSRIDGFVSNVASFRKIEVLDIRPTKQSIPNITFIQSDLMRPNHALKDSTDSISCLHAIEHFGLGRYGDPIDIDGTKKGLSNILELLKANGTLYLSLPIGSERIEFNAHRVFNAITPIKLLEGKCTLTSFSYVNDQGDLIKPENPNTVDFEMSFGCEYGCGIYTFTKNP